MDINVITPNKRFSSGLEERVRVIELPNGIDVVVGLTYTTYSGHVIMYGGQQNMYMATIAVGVNHLGELRLMKNRWGGEGLTNELEIRGHIYNSLREVFGIIRNYDLIKFMTIFNSCISEITQTQIICSLEYPLGISFRKYMSHKNRLTPRKHIKKHMFL